ncbi:MULTISPECIES: RNA polymerase factor sigma-54 [unclassified Roseitalea]|uniref:RNA polymerase factor sigma-54 n=1 Tax=unclassified Roseitalea TaxID=2639107 RepID=UPI00273FD44D|nr:MULTISPECIES: RNA polymerase factor sigma-54 [unclassified Roseitalea]
MALSARLNLRQTQSMVMTPQLLQSIRLLQLGHVELQRFIDEQIERNPLLERAEEGAARAAEIGPDDAENAPGSGAEPAAHGTDIAAMAEAVDAAPEDVFAEDAPRMERASDRLGPGPASGPVGGVVETDWTVEELPAGRPGLRQIVAEQIALAFAAPADRMIAAELADGLDERGYLDADLGALARRFGVDRRRVATVLKRLQRFDPPGLFARDLGECLALQCARRDRLDPAMAALLENLELLARRDFAALGRICGVDQSDLIDMLAEIRTLDPRPGLAFDSAPTETIIHDVELRKAPDGAWLVDLNADALPRVLVDRGYHARISAGVRDGEEKAFLTQCLQDASWLERSLDQRANTILKVAAEIVRQQDGFFEHGVGALKPMTMKAVADAISMHESTISRVAANKYMLTPRGLFEFRYFFTGTIGARTGTGEGHSTESVRQRIRDLIDAESPAKVLSDDALVSMLQDEGIDIARRTVAKYRESMNIASSVQRRREKRARAMAEAG